MDRFIIDALRRASLRWMPRTKAKQEARLGRNRYKCADCAGEFPHKKIILDHIAPVVDPETGFTDWNAYVARLFCEKSGFQVLCKACSNRKTRTENARRREVARENKPKATKRTRRKPKAKDAGPG